MEDAEEDERCSWHIKIEEHLCSKAGTAGSACSHPEILHHVLANELKDLMRPEELYYGKLLQVNLSATSKALFAKLTTR